MECLDPEWRQAVGLPLAQCANANAPPGAPGVVREPAPGGAAGCLCLSLAVLFRFSNEMSFAGHYQSSELYVQQTLRSQDGNGSTS